MSVVSRWLLFLVALWIQSAGIVLVVKSFLGTSPISSLPYVMSETFPFTFGESQYGLPFGTDADIEKEIPEGAAAAGAHDDDFCCLHRPLHAGFRKHHAGRLLAKAHHSFPRCVYGFSGGGTSGHRGRPEASGGGTGLYRFRYLSPGLRQGQDRKRWDPCDARHLSLLCANREHRGRP